MASNICPPLWSRRRDCDRIPMWAESECVRRRLSAEKVSRTRFPPVSSTPFPSTSLDRFEKTSFDWNYSAWTVSWWWRPYFLSQSLGSLMAGKFSLREKGWLQPVVEDNQVRFCSWGWLHAGWGCGGLTGSGGGGGGGLTWMIISLNRMGACVTPNQWTSTFFLGLKFFVPQNRGLQVSRFSWDRQLEVISVDDAQQ